MKTFALNYLGYNIENAWKYIGKADNLYEVHGEFYAIRDSDKGAFFDSMLLKHGRVRIENKSENENLILEGL